MVSAGQYSRAADISGCSAAFFNIVGQDSVAHLTAGNEATEAREAAQQAQTAGTTDSVEVHAPNSNKFNTIKTAIRAVLPDITVEYKPYTLNTADRNECWMFTHQSGDKTNTVTTQTYKCA